MCMLGKGLLELQIKGGMVQSPKITQKTFLDTHLIFVWWKKIKFNWYILYMQYYSTLVY